MKRIPRNRAIEIVLQGVIDDIEDWVIQGQREDLKRWLFRTLDLGKRSVSEMVEDYGAYFDLGDDDYE